MNDNCRKMFLNHNFENITKKYQPFDQTLPVEVLMNYSMHSEKQLTAVSIQKCETSRNKN